MESVLSPSQTEPQPEVSPSEVKQYERQKLSATLCSVVISLTALTLAALFIGPFLDTVVRTNAGENRWWRLTVLAFIYAALIELLTTPIDFWSGYVLEHRYQLSNMKLRAWVWRRIKGYLLGGSLGLGLLMGLYALIWNTGAWWWLWAALGWLAVSVVLGQFLPVVILPLFYKVTRLEDENLLPRLRSLADGTGMNVEGVYRLELSAETRKANAALAGLGRTRRVLLGDTLLQQFTPEEIEVVFAHELGHYVFRHLPKFMILSVLFSLGGLWLANTVLQLASSSLGYSGTPQLEAYQDPGALPLLLLVLSAFALLISPPQNAISRGFERQCDAYALARTKKPSAYRSAFRKLAQTNMADPDPHPLIVFLFDDHPPIRERLALADSYEPVG